LNSLANRYRHGAATLVYSVDAEAFGLMKHFVIGVDFGTDSVRAVVMDARNGDTLSQDQKPYSRWQAGQYCDPARSRFRQHPRDYVESFESCVREAIRQAGHNAGQAIAGIAVDTTGSTPCPVNRAGLPLALLPAFETNPNAMFHLWKDHTAVQEAADINRLAAAWGGADYTTFQGLYSSEWFWAKILHTIRADAAIRQAAWSWVEHCDWMPALLTGQTDPLTMYRSACAAGHKALWHSAFDGLPGRAFLTQLDPHLGIVRDHYGGPPRTADARAGRMTAEWAERLGLTGEVVVGGSSFDAHAGAVGAGIRPGVMVKVIGTSTVDLMVAHPECLRGKNLKTICGQAEHSILPGFVGIEAGQAAFGDVYAWFKDLLLWPLRHLLPTSSVLTEEQKIALAEEFEARVLVEITTQAECVADDTLDVTALDWFNGRRYPAVNESLTSALAGLHLSTDAPTMYKALVLATAFGSRRILESFLAEGLAIDRIIAVGGIAQKSPFVVQALANVLKRPLAVSAATQACARGAAVYAAVAAGLHPSIPTAQAAMEAGVLAVYSPQPAAVEAYDRLYRTYLSLGGWVEQAADGF
jgi:L-ribulokinase